MMKKFLLIGIILFLFTDLEAQTNAQVSADSIAYQLQRKKINSMLDMRKVRFGQYSQSLSEHTGIFGFQTKSDIRRSNDILMDIVKTDDNIYKELKILLEYRAFQQRQIQNHSKEAETINQNYVNLISKLRQQNTTLKAAAQSDKTMQRIYILIIVLMIASILFLISRKSKLKV
jgi:cell division protein FtsX